MPPDEIVKPFIPVSQAEPSKQKPEPEPAKKGPKDPLRETLETVVFVVVLVLLLKSFVAEAFVIPTGSMATTLLGDHCDVTCSQCGYAFPINVMARDDHNDHVVVYTDAICPNCRYVQPVERSSLAGGDKLLVAKPQYDLMVPKRWDVIVFKFPGEARWDPGPGDVEVIDPHQEREGGPQESFAAKNYIKRLVGLPGEKLRITYGDLYLFESNQGGILRKPPAKMLEMRRIVSDNDRPARDLGPAFQRWKPVGDGWKAADEGKTFELQLQDQVRWLRYQNLLLIRGPNPGAATQIKTAPPPQLITDFLGYNSGITSGNGNAVLTAEGMDAHWVGDLMIDVEVEVVKPEGELTLELVEGTDLHQAIFNLQDGKCVLKVTRNGAELKSEEKQTSLKGTGRYRVRFANFDDRLTLWVDGKLPFEDGMEFPGQPPEERGPRLADLRPASIGARNAEVKVRKLQLWRDLYYTSRTAPDIHLNDVERSPARLSKLLSLTQEEWDERLKEELAKLSLEEQKLPDDRKQTLAAHRATWKDWEPFYHRNSETYEVPPGEFFGLGDNSTHSADSRKWGTIPERFLLGKAVIVYWPLDRFGLIR